RVTRQQTSRGGSGALPHPLRHRAHQQFGQGVLGELSKELTLDQQTFLEGWVAHAYAFAQVAAIELRCLLNGLQRPTTEQPLEGGDVAGHGRWVEPDRLAI